MVTCTMVVEVVVDAGDVDTEDAVAIAALLV